MPAKGAIDMKLVSPRPTARDDRILALEEARKSESERLDKIDLKVTEMHEILIAVRTIGKFIRRAVYYFGGPSAVGAAALYGWHALTGH
jgi:hypothetical protein